MSSKTNIQVSSFEGELVRAKVEFDELRAARWFELIYPQAITDAINNSQWKASGEGLRVGKIWIRKDTSSAMKSMRRESKPLKWRTMAKRIAIIFIKAGGYIVNPKTGRLVDYAGHLEEYQERVDGEGAVHRAVRRTIELIPYYYEIELRRILNWQQ